MNILLANPSQYEVYGKAMSPNYPPLGLGYLAATLEKEGHTVRILDVDAEGINVEELIKDFKPDFVGITCTTPTFKSAIRLAETIKSIVDVPIALGGIHPTIDHTPIIENSIDCLVVGEGEETMKELAQHIRDYSQVSGLVLKDRVNPARSQIDNLDNLPFPARHLFGSNRYTYPDSLYSQAFPLMTSRGCPGLCTYCCSKQIFRKFRFRSAKNVVDEIEFLVNKYGAKEIHIWDDCFTLVKKRVFEIRDELKQRNIKIHIAFPNGLRVDMVDKDILKALKDMGTYSIAFGVESGNQNVLNTIKKGITLQQVRQAFKDAKEIGFETWGFFMIGLPGDDKTTMMETINFAIELDPDIAKFHILKPYPGSEAHQWLLERNLIDDLDYSHYGIHTTPVHHLPTVSRDELITYQKLAYRKFYMRPKLIIKQVFRMKSWNRLKLNLEAGVSVIRMMLK